MRCTREPPSAVPKLEQIVPAHRDARVVARVARGWLAPELPVLGTWCAPPYKLHTDRGPAFNNGRRPVFVIRRGENVTIGVSVS